MDDGALVDQRSFVLYECLPDLRADDVDDAAEDCHACECQWDAREHGVLPVSALAKCSRSGEQDC